MQDFCYHCAGPLEGNVKFCPHCGFCAETYQPEPHQLVPGTLLKERYRVGRVLGEGGFGITYVGVDTVLDLKVAIKEFYMSGYVNRNNTVSTTVQANTGNHTEIFEKNRERFLQEARTLAKFFSEPGVVSVIDFFRENNTAYIVMEFLDGVTLKDQLEGKTMSWDRLSGLLEPVLQVLIKIHRAGLIHRDISPDNIMVTERGQVKLLDFGAAREFAQGDVKSLSVILKPGYAPVEQYRTKGQQGPWTDVYAICATMYRCLTGVVPDDSMDRIYDDQLLPPAERGNCPPAVSDVLMKGLAVRQEQRWPSVEALCEALRQAQTQPLHRTAPNPPGHREYIPKPAVPTREPVRAAAGSSSASIPVRTGPVMRTGPVSVQTAPKTDPDATEFVGDASAVFVQPARPVRTQNPVSQPHTLKMQSSVSQPRPSGPLPPQKAFSGPVQQPVSGKPIKVGHGAGKIDRTGPKRGAAVAVSLLMAAETIVVLFGVLGLFEMLF